MLYTDMLYRRIYNSSSKKKKKLLYMLLSLSSYWL